CFPQRFSFRHSTATTQQRLDDSFPLTVCANTKKSSSNHHTTSQPTPPLHPSSTAVLHLAARPALCVHYGFGQRIECPLSAFAAQNTRIAFCFSAAVTRSDGAFNRLVLDSMRHIDIDELFLFLLAFHLSLSALSCLLFYSRRSLLKKREYCQLSLVHGWIGLTTMTWAYSIRRYTSYDADHETRNDFRKSLVSSHYELWPLRCACCGLHWIALLSVAIDLHSAVMDEDARLHTHYNGVNVGT
ncbi:hypothetical protein LZ30DRAFT_803040, partial [Colletotrichum cereale]